MSVGIIEGNVKHMQLLKVTFDPANMTGTATTDEQDIALPGAVVGDAVFVTKEVNLDGFGIVNARISAADTLSLTFINPTGAAKNDASATYDILVVRPENVMTAVKG